MKIKVLNMGRKSVDMLNGPILPKIIMFVMPLLLTNLLQQLYHMADMIVVGRFAGSLALAAVGATHSLSNIILNILVGISVGVSTVVAQAVGSGDKECIDRVVHTSMAVSIIGSIILSIIGIIFCKPILALMDTPEDIINQSALYMKIIFAGYPIVSIYNFGSAILRAKGDTKRPLIFLAISGFVNVVLNCIFVIIFKMSVAGVAIATVISQLISAVLVVLWMLKEEYPFKLNCSKIKIHIPELKRILGLGLPIASQSATFSFANVIIQSAINSFGSFAVAGAGAAMNVCNILYVFMNSPSHAATIFTGQNFGAKKFDRIPKIITRSSLLVIMLWIVSGTFFIIFAKPLLHLFASEEKVINFGHQVVVVLSSTYFICGIMDVLSGALKGINKSLISMINSITSLFGVRIMWIFTYFRSHRSLTVLYTSYPLSWIFALCVHIIFFIYYFKKAKKTLA